MLKLKKTFIIIATFILVGLSIATILFVLFNNNISIDDSGAANHDSFKVTGNKLYYKNSPFIVRSNQYINIVYKDGTNPIVNTYSAKAFNSITSTERAIDLDFYKMNKLGYNTVRLVWNTNEDADFGAITGTCKDGKVYKIDNCISKKAINNLISVIDKAEKYDLKVILSFVGGTPFTYYTSSSMPFDSANINFMKEETVRDYGRFLYDFITYIKANTQGHLVNVLAIEPYAEPYVDTTSFPFRNKGDVITTPQFYVDGNYPINDELLNKNNGISSVSMRKLINFSFTNSFNYWSAKVKSASPGMLVMYDQFPAYAIKNETQRHVSDDILTSKFLQADIIGMQLYPDYFLYAQGTAQGDIKTIMNFTSSNFSSQLSSKPFIVIEFGLSKTHPNVSQVNSLLLNWISSTCYLNPIGWSLFNWDSDNFDYVTGQSNNYSLANALSPKTNPRICN